jgi:hypothetical protein
MHAVVSGDTLKPMGFPTHLYSSRPFCDALLRPSCLDGNRKASAGRPPKQIEPYSVGVGSPHEPLLGTRDLSNIHLGGYLFVGGHRLTSMFSTSAPNGSQSPTCCQCLLRKFSPRGCPVKNHFRSSW